MSRHSEERLGPYLEGDLGPEERRVLELHLGSCKACRAALAELRATVDLLRLVPEPHAPPRLGQQVMDRIAALQRRPLARFSGWLFGADGSPLVSVAGAVAATALVLLTVQVLAPSRSARVAGSLAPAATPSEVDVRETASATGDRAAPRSPRRLPLASARPAATGTRGLPSVFRLRPERSGGVGVGAAAPGASHMLPPRPALARCQAFGRGSADEGGSPGFDCRPWLSGMLALAQLDPHGFLGQVGLLPPEERSAWVEELVGFAARSGSLTRVVAGLRSSIDPGAALLAERFERGTRTAAR